MKNWLIRKLGGIVYSDIPVHIQNELMDYWMGETLDKVAHEMYFSGFNSYPLKNNSNSIL